MQEGEGAASPAVEVKGPWCSSHRVPQARCGGHAGGQPRHVYIELHSNSWNDSLELLVAVSEPIGAGDAGGGSGALSVAAWVAPPSPLLSMLRASIFPDWRDS